MPADRVCDLFFLQTCYWCIVSEIESIYHLCRHVFEIVAIFVKTKGDAKKLSVTGMGNGMVMLAVLTAFAPYFDKRKALSLALTASGSGLGMIIVPPILRQLFDNFSFSGALTLYGKL